MVDHREPTDGSQSQVRPWDWNQIRIDLPLQTEFRRPGTLPSLQIPLTPGQSYAAAQGAKAGVGATGRSLPTPFFWYDPPWQLADVTKRRRLAEVLGRWGVTIHIGSDELGVGAAADDDDDEPQAGPRDWPQMVTRRSDRVGWRVEDALTADLVELRLGYTTNDSDGGGYSAAQCAMFGIKPMSPCQPAPPSPLSWPPECSSVDDLIGAIAQLRSLHAKAVYVSCDDRDLERLLPGLAVAGADGVIVRFAGDPALALQVYRQWRQTTGGVSGATNGAVRVPRLWLAGGRLTAEDCIRCFALGASSVSVAALCQQWLGHNEQTDGPLETVVEQTLGPLRDQLKGWMLQLAVPQIDGLTGVSLSGV